MSGTIDDLIAHPQAANVLEQLQNWQNLSQSQASTALTQQQVAGAGLQNQLQGLNLARTGFMYGLAGIPNAGGAANGAGQPNYLAGLAPQGATPTQPFAPSGGAHAPNSLAGLTPSSSGQSSYAGQLGMEHLGVPMPPLVYASVATSPNPAEQLAKVAELRRQALFSAIDVPPANYPAAVDSMLAAGWITPEMASAAHADPATQDKMLSSFATPDSHQAAVTALAAGGMQMDPTTGQVGPAPNAIAAAGQKAGAVTGAQQASELPFVGPKAYAGAAGSAAGSGALVDVKVKNPDGSYSVQQVPPAQVQTFLQQHQGASAATTADMGNPSVSVGPDVYANRVAGFESGGASNAQSATSSATGAAQFTNQTWLDAVHSNNPGWANGLSDQQILAQRSDPAKSREMTVDLAQANAAKLSAEGIQPTTLNLGLAHRFGADGAVSLLNAPVGTPVAQVVSPDVMAANPDLKGKTVGQVTGPAFVAYGTNAVNFSAQPSAVAGVSAPTLGPQGQAALDVTKGQITGDQKTVGESLQGAQTAQQQQANLIQNRNGGTSDQINTGSLGEIRQTVQNFLATFSPESAQKFVADITGGAIDPTKAAATQEFVKLALQAAGSAEKANNPQGGLGITKVYQSAYPNLETQPGAIKDMLNLFLINQQRVIDHAQGQQAFFTQQQQAFGSGGKYEPVQNFDTQFLNTNPASTYVSAAAALNGKPYTTWSKGLTPDQQKAAIGIIWRADPSAVLTDASGKPRYNPALATATR